MRPALLVLCAALTACGGPSTSSDAGAGGGNATGGGSSTGGGGGTSTGGGSATGGGSSTGGGSATGGGSSTGGGRADAGLTVLVPAGPFLMGCNTCDADEAPAHVVTLRAFSLDLTEVTQGQYAACVNSACTVPAANWDPVAKGTFPVVNVTWDQAVAYCTWAGGRLPTEAEWEKAARGADGGTFPWGNGAASCALANTFGCGNVTEAVGAHPTGASPYGALDLAGNVWEWVADWYDASFYASAPSVDPTGPTTGTTRVYRGGSAGNDASLARASNRASTYNPAVGGSGLGFRCAY